MSSVSEQLDREMAAYPSVSRVQDRQLNIPKRFEIPDRNANPKRVQQVKSDADTIQELMDRLAALEAQQKANAPEAPHGYLANGEEAPNASYAYENPREYDHVLALATGELVGSPSVQSTDHWSRALQRNVKVMHVF